MTGRELIIYILSNNLENELVIKDGKFIGSMTLNEAAVKLEVGTATVRALVDCNILDGINVGNELYIVKDSKFDLFNATHGGGDV